MTVELRAAIVLLCGASACAGMQASSVSPAAIAPASFYPLKAGNAWSYDVDTGDSSTTLAVTRVEAFDGRIAEVHTGRAVLRYEVLAEGIRVPPHDEWLLRAPLESGASWPARGGRTARVVATGASVETAAGRFEGCVEVFEVGGPHNLEVRTVYCPNVGPVAVDSTMRSKRSDRIVTVSAKLRGYEVSSDRASSNR